MELQTLISVLARRRRIRGRERWDRAELERHQASALAALRHHALTRSRFYQRFHRGLQSAPFGELPVLTKGTMMEHFDELVVDPEIRLTDALTHLEHGGDRRYLDRDVLMATSGSTGRRGVLLADRDEWTSHIFRRRGGSP